MRTRTLDTQMKTIANTMIGATKAGFTKAKSKATAAQATAATLMNLVQDDAATGDNRSLDSPWRAAEAVHLYMLAQRQLYARSFLDALATGTQLRKYCDILSPKDVHSLIAIAAYHTKAWKQCSIAFSDLYDLEWTKEQEEELTQMEFAIFAHSGKQDPVQVEQICKEGEAVCMVSGRGIGAGDTDGIHQCRRCARKMFSRYMRSMKHCPLCHMSLH